MHNLLDYLEHSAKRFPGKTAFSDENERVTFSQLKEIGQSVGTAIAMRAQGLRMPVAVMTNHSVADIAAFIGTLYAGCFYVPLDGSAPKDYSDTLLKSIHPAMTISAKTLAELPSHAPDSYELETARRNIFPNDPAYAIFTSGSSGLPKAALISHASVVNLMEWLGDTFSFSEHSIFAGQTPFYFDTTVEEMYSTIKNGATTHLLPKNVFISPLRAMKLVEQMKANVLTWSTAAAKLIANSGVFEKFIPEGITDVIFGGENLPVKILNIWRQAMPETRFTNTYGLTETTVDCSYYIVNRELSDDESVPIGYPCSGYEILLLDEDGASVPDGEPGEIYIRGVGVGLGYYGDPGRTDEVFVQNPLNSHYRDIVCRTGDIARMNKYGELVFMTRADNQIKHMGCRVELGEVETIVAGIDDVHLVFCAYDKEKSKILLFFEGSISDQQLAAELNGRLPRYMLPNIIIKIDKMPATPTGKIDRLRAREEYYSGL